MAPLVVWVRLRCRLPNRSGLKSPPCAARGIWTWRARLGQTMSLITRKEDFTQNGQQYDLILAANGYHSISAYKRALRPKGIYVMAGGSMAQMFQAMLMGPWISMTGSKKMGT